MSVLPRKILRWLGYVVALLLVAALAAAGWGWWRLRSSLPQLDGAAAVAGLSAPVRVERDALGVPTITGASRVDVARALGFLHAQDRFFQMDLARRSGAGELAELVGPAALPLDQNHRLHGFRRTAATALARLDPAHRAMIEAYSVGVNAGLAALRSTPWEYSLLRTTPRRWEAVDTILVIYAMWFDLQDASGRTELSLQALRDALGTSGVDYFAPRGTSWDAALDGSQFPSPGLPLFRLRAPGEKPQAAAERLAEPLLPGSNSFAVAGNHVAGGGALLANDMHLNLNVPHIWYRAVMAWTDAGATHRVVGVTLPGVPVMVVGSNGAIAWGFTNAYIDTTDVVTVEADNTAHAYYRRPGGYGEIENRRELIAVKGAAPVPFTARWTEWGPIIGGPENSRYQAMRWNAHDPEATNINSLDLETATTAAEGIAIAHRAGLPNQNFVVADRAGTVAWTLAGRIPKRVGFDGRLPVSWAWGDRKWDGWLSNDEIPVVTNPADGLIWSANHRMVGGAAYEKIGDGGFANGARAAQIRDDLRQLAATGKPVTPADLLAIQLDDRALFLERWHQDLLKVLNDETIAAKSGRAALRDAVRQWNGRASIDSAAYRIVRDWRLQVADRAFAPFYDAARSRYPGFTAQNFQYEDALWQLVHERPDRLLNPKYASWDALLLDAADSVLADIDDAGLLPARYTWGEQNRLSMRHPFSRILPGLLGHFLDMPADPLPGAADMPRVQGRMFGASERLVVSPGREAEGILHMPGGQSGHPLSPFYRAGHSAWVEGLPTSLLPGAAQHVLTLQP